MGEEKAKGDSVSIFLRPYRRESEDEMCSQGLHDLWLEDADTVKCRNCSKTWRSEQETE